MPIAPTDIKFRLTGGAANASQIASLGGAVSANDASSALFDDVTAAQSAAGLVEYRCIAVKNTHATLTLTSALFWMAANTPSADTTIDVGVGTSAVNAAEQTVANEATAPAGVTFLAAASLGAAVALGDLAPGAYRNVWLRRTVNAGAVATSDTASPRATGTTAA